jgi:hypothetical protein
VSPWRWIAVGLLLVVMTGISLRGGLRTGTVHLRGPHGRVERRKSPFRYWASIAVTAAVFAGGVAMIAFGVIRAAGWL